MNSSTIFTLVQTMVVLLVVIAFANMSLKLLNKKIQGTGKMLNVIERIQVTNTSSLGIVKVLEEYYLMSFSEKGSKVIRKLSYEVVEKSLQQDNQETEGGQLRQLLQIYMEKRKKGD